MLVEVLLFIKSVDRDLQLCLVTELLESQHGLVYVTVGTVRHLLEGGVDVQQEGKEIRV